MNQSFDLQMGMLNAMGSSLDQLVAATTGAQPTSPGAQPQLPLQMAAPGAQDPMLQFQQALIAMMGVSLNREALQLGAFMKATSLPGMVARLPQPRTACRPRIWHCCAPRWQPISGFPAIYPGSI
ncbi:MAG: hypothetical protein AB1758_12380 [Candidatus Eremiobacterota bacterium]